MLWVPCAAAGIAAVWAALAALRKKGKLRLSRFLVPRGAARGVDVSRHQGRVDMGTLARQGVRFAWIKATEGMTYTDERFRENRESAEKAGVVWGAYHFFSFETPGERQAEHYIETVGDLAGAFPPAVDVELYGKRNADPPDPADVRKELAAMLGALEKRYGVKPFLYTFDREVRRTYLSGAFEAYPKWVQSVDLPPRFNGCPDYVFWQYSHRGRLEGYDGEERCIDLDALRPGIRPEDLTIGSGGFAQGPDMKRRFSE